MEDLFPELSEKKRLLDEYLLLTEEQSRILAEKDEEALGENITKRQALIEKINEIPAILSGSAAVEREITEILEKIRRIDFKNRIEAKKLLDYFAAEVKGQAVRKKSIGLYNQAEALSGPEFLDKKR